MVVRLGLTGDVMLGRLVDDHQRQRPVTAVWGDMLEVLKRLDGLVINLECCLSRRGTPWQRTYRPFHFRADPAWAIPALDAAGVDACALANNHLLDFEEPALEDTLANLDDVGIVHSGAGMDIDRALEPARFRCGDLDVAVVSFTDNTPEFAAGIDHPGVAYITIDAEHAVTKDRVSTALQRAQSEHPDVLIASLHWGPNMVVDPPDSFRRFARWLIDAGVDIVHGHSAHVFQGIEAYGSGLILYDTGDFVDDYAVDPELRNDRSFLFVVTIEADGTPARLGLIPTEIDDFAVHRASPSAVTWSHERMRERSALFDTTFRSDGDSLVLDITG